MSNTASPLVMRYALGLCAVVITACGSVSDITDRIAGHRASPFALYGRDDMRAGLRFEVLRDAAKKESVKQYECLPLWAKAQRCSLAIEGGQLVAIVDSTDRVIRLLSTPDSLSRSGINVHGQLIMRDVVRDTRAAWDSVGTLQRHDTDPLAPQLLWLDRTRRWGGTLWYSRAHRADVPLSSQSASDAELTMTLPESLGVTDLPAYTLFAQRQPTPPPAPAPRVAAVTTPPPPPTPDEIIEMLRSDLRAVTAAQEGALHTTGQYKTQFEQLQLTPSPKVRVEFVRPTIEGYSAIATHPDLPGVSCVVYAGDVASPPSTRKNGSHGGVGEVVCDRP
jgi:hypothetical protein